MRPGDKIHGLTVTDDGIIYAGIRGGMVMVVVVVVVAMTLTTVTISMIMQFRHHERHKQQPVCQQHPPQLLHHLLSLFPLVPPECARINNRFASNKHSGFSVWMNNQDEGQHLNAGKPVRQRSFSICSILAALFASEAYGRCHAMRQIETEKQ
jgi:hypothetical protein